jgi:hypothetical protein
MKTLDWIRNEIIGNGLLCAEYAEKVRNAKSKKQLFDICADANGASFLPEMRAKGYPLPYEVVWDEFGRYINGNYKPVFSTPLGGEYTSAIYCQANDVKDIVVDTTLACFLSCMNEVWIQQFNVARIVVDENCFLKLHCPANSKCVVEIYGGGEVAVVEGEERVKIRRK